MPLPGSILSAAFVVHRLVRNIPMEIRIYVRLKKRMSDGAERSEQGEAAVPHSITSIRDLRTEGNSQCSFDLSCF